VLACGPPEAVDALCQWLWRGPPAASVTSVDIEDLPADSVAPWPGAFRTD
jgi:acylphosphatase